VHSGTRRTAWLIVCALSLAPLTSMPIAAAQPDLTPTAVAAAPDAETIARAVAEVKADPNFATSRTIKTLRWKGSTTPKSTGIPAWLQWVIGLFRWVDQAGRLFVWCAAILLAGVLGMYIYRILRVRIEQSGSDAFIAPTHVQDLDIRPESLPDDVGGAARALWDRGEHRAALALLYRGLLSRLAHAHEVPIRDSSTEGDCLALASTHLDNRRHDYASRLVRIWQRTVYGHEPVETTIVHALCDGFAPALDAAAAERPV